jgi:hypothetical protein
MIRGLFEIVSNSLQDPSTMKRLVRMLPSVRRGVSYARSWQLAAGQPHTTSSGGLGSSRATATSNPLREYFDSYSEGPGIWKWLHYFDLYHRHLSKFIDREVHIVEIGVYSGGSLRMWRDYLGAKCHVHGVDIQEACKAYENGYTSIDIGDQSDRHFWKRFRETYPVIDVIIDDGGHSPEQQIVTLEEMLPHLQPGGVFLCEDVHGDQNMFTCFVHGLTANLNSYVEVSVPAGEKSSPAARESMVCQPSRFQADVGSIHMYPFMTVIEKTDVKVEQFAAWKRGTQWQPFL